MKRLQTFDELTAGHAGSWAGWITVEDREWLAQFLQREYLLRGIEPSIIEIGVFCGSTTNLICLASGGSVIAVDDWSAGPHPNHATLRDCFIDQTTQAGFYPERIRIVDGSSMQVGPTWCEGVNLVYVDGDHSYEAARLDIANFSPWASDFMLVDDYDVPDVKRATDEWIERGGWRVVRMPDCNPAKLFAAERIK